MAIQKYNSCTKHFYDKINNKNTRKTIKNTPANTPGNSKTNIFKNISNHISTISKYNLPIKNLNSKSIYAKNFEEMIVNLKNTYYVDNINDINNDTNNENTNNNNTNNDTTNNINSYWIANANSYLVGESFYTGFPPTISTPNYDDDYTFLVNSKDVVVQKYLRKGVPYEKYLISAMSAYMPHNGVMLDIGTNIGTVAIPMSRVKNGATIFAFEPFRQNYVLCLENIRRNNAYNIVPMPVAVGDKSRDSVSLSSEVFVAPEQLQKGEIGRKQAVPDGVINGNDATKEFHYAAIQLGVGGDKVRMVSIDDLGINYDVMKLDIEGAEPLAFYGAKESIKRCMPIIAFEHNTNQVTKEMRESMNIPDHIADFNIVRYCYSLGYREICEIPFDNFMLIPPNRKVVSPNSMWKYGQVTNKFRQFKPSDLDGYRLYKYLIPRW